MIESVKSLEAVLEPYAGQVVYNEEDKKVYRWDPIEGWQEESVNGNITMSAYDINKQIIGQLQILDETALQEKKKLIRQYITEIDDEYYMLLCRDTNYYTIFHKTPVEHKMADEIFEDVLIDECLPAMGDVKSIERTDDGAIEIWFQSVDEVFVAYLFPYGAGVVECV